MQSMQTPAPDAIFADRYKIEGQLGVGGFGAVYKGMDIHMKRDVALKTLLPHLATIEGIEDRFLREATLASSLSSPHTIKFFDFGKTDDGTLYIAMELLNGQELEDVIQKEGPRTPEQTRTITLEILDSLGEAHSQGIVHRDLKPSNIFMSKVGRRDDFVKILDFGIAKALDSDNDENQKKLTATGQTLGTPYYMAPEQIRQGQVGPYTDLYALGLIMIEMLTGQVAVEGNSPIEIVMIHASFDPIGIPEWIDQSPLGPIVRKSIDKAPGNRYASAEEMIADLEAADLSGMIVPEDLSSAGKLSYADTGQMSPANISTITGRNAHGISTPNGGQTQVDGGSPNDTTIDAVPASTQKNNRAAFIIVVILLVFAIGIGIYFLATGPSGDTPDGSETPRAGATDEPGVDPAPETRPPEGPVEVKILIDSVPQNATVIDGSGKTFDGLTPLLVKRPPKDDIETWTLKLEGYEDHTLKIIMSEGVERTVRLKKLIPMVSLTVDSDPPGAVLVDGRGNALPTPFEKTLPAERRTETWTLQLEGYEDAPVLIDFQKGIEKTFTLEKTPPKVSVTINSSPEGAIVIDASGKELGPTPLAIQVLQSDAKETWTLKLPGYRTASLKVSLGEEIKETVKLQRQRRPPRSSSSSGGSSSSSSSSSSGGSSSSSSSSSGSIILPD